MDSILVVVGWMVILTSVNGFTYRSAPGCPKEKGIAVWLQDEIGHCHKLNTRGPCGENMLFFPHPVRSEKIQGFCECFDARKETEEEIRFLNNRNLTGCLENVRGQIFVPERNRCYSVFDQGPCPDGKWLVLNSATLHPVCVRNQCSPKSSKATRPNPLSPQFRFAHSAADDCYDTMTRSYCPKNYQLRFSPNDWLPKCRYAPQGKTNCTPKPAVEEIFRIRCKPGSRRDHLSKCTRSISPR